MFGLYFGAAVCGRKNIPKEKKVLLGFDSHVPTSINLKYKKYWKSENDVMAITHCSLTISTNSFGFGRQDCEHRSYWVLMITSLEFSFFFVFKPKRRRWPRRASINVCKKEKRNINLTTRLFILIDCQDYEFWRRDAGL